MAANVCLLFLGCALCSACADSLADKIHNERRNWATITPDALFMDAAARATVGTKYEHQWQINAEPKADWLNIYLGKGGLLRVRENCQYLGDEIIVCDSMYVKTFLESKNAFFFNPHGNEPSTRRRMQEVFLTWLLAHELGHALSDERGRHYAASLDDIVGNVIDYKPEVAADSFAAEELLRDKDFASFAVDTLMALLNAEIQHAMVKKYGIKYESPMSVGIHVDYRNGIFLEYASAGTHPEFFLRCARLLEILLSRDWPSELPMLTEFMAHLRAAQ